MGQRERRQSRDQPGRGVRWLESTGIATAPRGRGQGGGLLDEGMGNNEGNPRPTTLKEKMTVPRGPDFSDRKADVNRPTGTRSE
jgi:hypothetical protein